MVVLNQTMTPGEYCKEAASYELRAASQHSIVDYHDNHQTI